MPMPRGTKGSAGITAKGEAMYPFLTKPDKRFKKEFGEFKVNLILEPGTKTDEFVSMLEEIRDTFFDECKTKMKEDIKLKAKAKKLSKREVYEEEVDDEGEETGRYIFKFASVAGGLKKKDNKLWSFIPRLYDSKAQLIKGEISVGNGSIIQVKYVPLPYCLNTDLSVGVKMYLNDVMVHTLVEYQGSSGFEASDDDEGFTYDAGSGAAPEAHKGEPTATEKPVTSDDIPF